MEEGKWRRVSGGGSVESQWLFIGGKSVEEDKKRRVSGERSVEKGQWRRVSGGGSVE